VNWVARACAHARPMRLHKSEAVSERSLLGVGPKMASGE
jgi:hypothetical protein